MSTADTTTEAFANTRSNTADAPAGPRADPAASPRPRPEQAGVLRRSRRATPLLGQGRHQSAFLTTSDGDAPDGHTQRRQP